MAKSSKKGTKDSGERATEKSSLMQFLISDMEELLQRSITDRSNHTPPVDVFSTDDFLYIDMNLPGVKEDEIEVIFFKGTIKVTAIKYECFDEENLNYICMERSFGKIGRIIEIPFPVNTSKINAEYNHGVLTITLPRVSEKRGMPINIPVGVTDNKNNKPE